MPVRHFAAPLLAFKTPAGTWHYVEVPFDVQEAFGSRVNVRVMGTANGAEFATTLFSRANGEPHLLFLNGKVRKQAGIVAGDPVAISIEPDPRPREIVVPEDLELILEEENLRPAFDALLKGRRKYLVDLVEGAKHVDTRIRRLGKCVELIRKWLAEKNNPST